MRTRNLSLPLLVSCLLAALLVATPIAQTQLVPNGPAIPPIALRWLADWRAWAWLAATWPVSWPRTKASSASSFISPISWRVM